MTEAHNDSAAAHSAEQGQVVQALVIWVLRSDKACWNKIWDCAKSKGDASVGLDRLIKFLKDRAKQEESATKSQPLTAANGLEGFQEEKNSDFRVLYGMPPALI